MLENIADLARIKPFAALDAAERRIVLSEMSETEYQELHRAMSFFKNSDADVVPPAALKNSLIEHFAREHGRRQHGFSGPLFRRPIPLWRAAAAVCLAIFGTWLLTKTNDSPAVGVPVSQTIVRTDTVWKTEIRWRERVVVQREKRPADIPPLIETGSAERTPPRVVVSENWSAPVVGTPIGDQQELLDFFTSAEAEKKD